MSMLALSVTAPWAWAMFHLGQFNKDIENRSWAWWPKIPLPKRILIHASKNPRADDYQLAGACIYGICRVDLPPIHDLPHGGIVGAVTVTQCVTDHPSLWFGGPFGFVLTQHVALPRVVKCKGRQGLWPIGDDLEVQVRSTAREVAV